MNKKDLITLALANIAVIIIAIIQKLSLSQLLWIYWMQSVIIGIFQCIKILFANKLCVIEHKKDIVEFSTKGRIAAVIFFIMHYGMFHLVYALFLMDLGMPSQETIYVALIFAVNQLFTLHKEKTTINKLLWKPYIRIIPMHLMMFIAFILPFIALPIFLILKTTADILSEKFVEEIK